MRHATSHAEDVESAPLTEDSRVRAVGKVLAETVERTPRPRKEAGQRSKARKDHAALTVRVDGLAVRRPDGEHAGDQDVLEARNEEQRRVLVVERLELLVVDVGLGVPENQAMSTGPHHVCCIV
jgi:hypothetical protein